MSEWPLDPVGYLVLQEMDNGEASRILVPKNPSVL